MVEYKDYYKIMGLPKGASQGDIKKAYRKLARKYHPDVSKEKDAEERFKEVGEAYEVLKDPEKRAQYDQFGEHWQQAGTQGPQAGAQSRRMDPEEAKAFEDFINDIFGQRHEAYSNRYHRGNDVYASIEISLEDAYKGTEKTIRLSQPVVNPQGYLVEKKRNLQVKIPAGVTNRQQIRLRNQGEPGENGQSGDLYLEVHIHPHPSFHLRHKDVHLDVILTPWEAALGSEKMVETLGGKVKVKIPPGTDYKSHLRLKGRGLPGNSPGDQLLHFRIENPKPLSPKAKELYQALADEYSASKTQSRSQ